MVRQGRHIVQLIQVCDDLSDESTRSREVSALQEAMEETALKESFLLTASAEEKIVIGTGTVHVIPVYQWLLQ